jgi:acetyl-CoA C-acetyltransferase
MGIYGDRCAQECKLTRQDQDDFAVRSFTRARKAIAEGAFKAEIVPVAIPGKKGATLVSDDKDP